MAKLVGDMSDVEKAVWKSAIASSLISGNLIGGETGEKWDNWNEWNSVNYQRAWDIIPVFDTKENTVVFKFYVSSTVCCKLHSE